MERALASLRGPRQCHGDRISGWSISGETSIQRSTSISLTVHRYSPKTLATLTASSVADLFMFLYSIRTSVTLQTSTHIAALHRLRALSVGGESLSGKVCTQAPISSCVHVLTTSRSSIVPYGPCQSPQWKYRCQSWSIKQPKISLQLRN